MRLLVFAAVFALAGCGSASSPRAPAPEASVAAAVWSSSVGGFIENLDENVLLSTSGGDTLAAARSALHDESDVYGMLVAYTAFGGCRQTLVNLGAPPASLRSVQSTLAAAGRRLERASALFARAVQRSDARALLEATRTTLKVAPLLSRARIELRSAR